MRLIDAETLKVSLTRYFRIHMENYKSEHKLIYPIVEEEFKTICNDVCFAVDVQPEATRCKDCKWFGHTGCAIRIVDDSDKPSAEDYCSFAERRADE